MAWPSFRRHVSAPEGPATPSGGAAPGAPGTGMGEPLAAAIAAPVMSAVPAAAPSASSFGSSSASATSSTSSASSASSSSSGSSASSRSESAGAVAAVAVAQPKVDFPAPERPPNAWRELPPLHTLGAASPMLDRRFDGSLSAYQSPALGLAPLGHLRSDDAPRGLVQLEGRLVPPVPQSAESPRPGSVAPVTPPLPTLVLRAPTPVKPAEDDKKLAKQASASGPLFSPPVLPAQPATAPPPPLPAADPGFVRGFVEPARPFPDSATHYGPSDPGVRPTGAEGSIAQQGIAPILPTIVYAPQRLEQVEQPATVLQPQQQLPLATPPAPQPVDQEERSTRGRLRMGEPLDAVPTHVESATNWAQTLVDRAASVPPPPPAPEPAPAAPAQAAMPLATTPQPVLEAAAPPAAQIEAPAPRAQASATAPVQAPLVSDAATDRAPHSAPAPVPPPAPAAEVRPAVSAPAPSLDLANRPPAAETAPQAARPAIAERPVEPPATPVAAPPPPAAPPAPAPQPVAEQVAPPASSTTARPAASEFRPADIVVPPAPALSAPRMDLASRPSERGPETTSTERAQTPAAPTPVAAPPAAPPPPAPAEVAPVLSHQEAPATVQPVVVQEAPAPEMPLATQPQARSDAAADERPSDADRPVVAESAPAPVAEAPPAPAPETAPLTSAREALASPPPPPPPVAPAAPVSVERPAAAAPELPLLPTRPVPPVAKASETTQVAQPARPPLAQHDAAAEAVTPVAMPAPPAQPAQPEMVFLRDTPQAPEVDLPYESAHESAHDWDAALLSDRSPLAPSLEDIAAALAHVVPASGPAETPLVFAQPGPSDGGQVALAQRTATAVDVPDIDAASRSQSFAPLVSEYQIVTHVHETDLVGSQASPTQPAGMGLATTLPQGVAVRTGMDVDDAAKSLGARAFTQDGQIHMPSKSLERSSQEVDALVAHELTHVLQQRALAGRTPTSSEMEAMEAQAQAVELATRLGQMPLSIPQQLQTSAAAAAESAPPTADAWSAPLALAQPHPQQVIIREIVHEQAPQERVLAEWTNPAFHESELVQLAPQTKGPAPAAFNVDDLDDEEIHQLFTLLYPMFEARMRNDMRRHKDRAGQLTPWNIG